MEGLLYWWGDGAWQHRWFVLDEERRLLASYTSKMKSEPGFGNVHLGQAQVAAVLGDQLTFSLHNSTKRILLKAESVEEREQWMKALQDCTSSSSSSLEEQDEVKDKNDSESAELDEEFYDANDEGFPQSPVSDWRSPDVEEDPDYVERADISSSIAQNRSVIMHVLSQARHGLDLTRMRMPAFILEKRSTLEMCSNFLAHPDIFAAVPDHATARERMVAIVRFYCSAFHTTRTSDVAKKPYNPILGETFHCFWDLPDTTATHINGQAESLLKSGPVPYASYDSVTFVAEQVSHHPPVSAFYAECLPKRMYVNGSVHTKIRFLGLSVGVYNTATVQLRLLDHGEEYTMTLPNTYIRSLLTYPWMELGGRSTISCLQSGYSAVIDFHSKPFYGGRKHQMSCDISHKSEKKPFHRIEGEWNGVMYTKHSNDSPEIFMDTINTPTVRKKLLKLSAQDRGESRRLWQHVTEALSKGDVDTASKAKHIVEEKQRADVRRRQEQGVEWQQKLFHKKGDGWFFNSPLDTRLTQQIS